MPSTQQVEGASHERHQRLSVAAFSVERPLWIPCANLENTEASVCEAWVFLFGVLTGESWQEWLGEPGPIWADQRRK